MSCQQGWFDDNHYAGEAYDFGMGYMARGGGYDAYAAVPAHIDPVTGHHMPGVRKCSICQVYKTK